MTWLGLACAMFGLAALDVRAQEGAEFTAAERRSLRGGELVRRQSQRVEGGARLIGGTSFIRVRAPVERVFEEITDTSAYPRLIPAVVEARLVEEHGDRRVVYLRHELSLVSVGYHVDVRIDRAAHSVRFELDPTRPHDVRAGRGFLSVSRYRRTDSIVTWGVMADPGNAVLTSLFGGVIQDWILRVPWCLRGRLEPGQQGC